MQETERQGRCARLAEDSARIQITGIGEDGSSVVRIDGQRILRAGMRKVVQRRIDSGEENKEADDQKDERF